MEVGELVNNGRRGACAMQDVCEQTPKRIDAGSRIEIGDHSNVAEPETTGQHDCLGLRRATGFNSTLIGDARFSAEGENPSPPSINKSRAFGTVEFTDTPLGWMAARHGQCWCEDCARKNAKGFGVTKEEAVAELEAEEASRD